MSELRLVLEKEVCRIGDQLITEANWDKEIVWQTLSIDHENQEYNVNWFDSESLYSGSAGIALFLIELGRFSEESRFGLAAERAMHKLLDYCSETPTENFSLLSGRMGVVVAALRFHEITGDMFYLYKALQLAQLSKDFLQFSTPVEDDLMNGSAGTLLGFLHLHSAVARFLPEQEAAILETINTCIERLIAQAHTGKIGLYWDKSPNQVRGLCGLSHGASGVGLVFLELAHYFQNKAFFYIAEQAFLYESQHYNVDAGNWKDFRKATTSAEKNQKYTNYYLSGDKEYFTQSSYMNAWCHGAAGIGITRLRVSKLLDNSVYQTEVCNAIATTIITDVLPHNIDTNFSLCHGSGGNADIFIEAYKNGLGRQYLHFAEIIASKSLQQFHLLGNYRSGFGAADLTMEDRGLFMGIAGVGYFYLRLLDPSQTPSILAPTLQTQCQSTLESEKFKWIYAPKSLLRRCVVEKHFSRTVAAIEKSNQAFTGYFNEITNNRIHEYDEFIQRVQQTLPTLSQEAQSNAEYHFVLESEKLRMLNSIESFAYLFVKAQAEYDVAQKLSTLPDQEYLQQVLILNDDVTIVEISETSLLLQITFDGVSEQILSPFIALVLRSFHQKITISKAIESILQQIEYTSDDEAQQIETAIREQIKHALVSGVLLADHSSTEQ